MKSNNYKAPSVSYLKADFEGMICASGGSNNNPDANNVSFTQDRYGEAITSWGPGFDVR